MTLSDTFKQAVDQIIDNYIQNPEEGRSIVELVVTDLTENGFVDDEFGEILYSALEEMNFFQVEQQVHDIVADYVKSRLAAV
jgi:hypothetical protein